MAVIFAPVLYSIGSIVVRAMTKQVATRLATTKVAKKITEEAAKKIGKITKVSSSKSSVLDDAIKSAQKIIKQPKVNKTVPKKPKNTTTKSTKPNTPNTPNKATTTQKATGNKAPKVNKTSTTPRVNKTSTKHPNAPKPVKKPSKTPRKVIRFQT